MPFLRSKECTLDVREVVETHRENVFVWKKKKKERRKGSLVLDLTLVLASLELVMAWKEVYLFCVSEVVLVCKWFMRLQ